MANRIRTGRDGICSLWNFISRRTMKAFEEEEQCRYTLSLSLSSFHLFSLFYLCCSICSFFSFFYYLSLHPWISILLFIASAAYMHINDESSNRTDRRARRIHFRFVSTRVIIRGEKWEKHLTIVHRVESRGRLMRTRVKNDFPPSLFFFLTRSGKVNLTCKWNRFLLLFFSRV